MPKITLTPAESLLVVITEDGLKTIRDQIAALQDELEQKQRAYLSAIFNSHGEKLVRGNIHFEKDANGRPVAFVWEKPASKVDPAAPAAEQIKQVAAEVIEEKQPLEVVAK